MSNDLVTLEWHDDIALLKLNRPESRNALNVALIRRLLERLEELAHSSARVVVLAANGRSFCAGADLKAGSDVPPGPENHSELGLVYRTQEHLAAMILAIYEHPLPIIAAIDGAAVGGGFAIALACDLRVASERAQFGSVFIKVGLSSCDVGVSYLLPRLVGVPRARELMLTGRIFNAEEADQIGLLHRLTKSGEELELALETARSIAANNEYGVWMTKKGINSNIDACSLRSAMELENRTQVLGWFSGNMREAMDAFVEKRPPHWKRL